MADVNRLCTRYAATVNEGQSIVDAAALMREEHVGDVIVVEPRGKAKLPVGILTDRDIVVGIIAKGISADAVTVGEAMTRGLLTLREDASLEFALHEMRRYRVRRAPVVGSSGELVGVIAIDDVIEHLAMQLCRLAELIKREQHAEREARQ